MGFFPLRSDLFVLLDSVDLAGDSKAFDEFIVHKVRERGRIKFYKIDF